MVEFDLARVPDSVRPFAAALLTRPDAGRQLIGMLGALGGKLPKEEAAELALLLREALPPSTQLGAVTETYLRPSYRSWYINEINDAHRNRAVYEGLAAVVTPESVVVEVGTGSGLFAMLAVRAGARHVYSFEMRPRLVAIARENIARSGLSDRITVIPMNAGDAVVGRDLPERGDVLLHEFSDPEFLFKGIDRIIPDLCSRLVKPGAAIVPQRFEARAQLCGDEALAAQLRVPDEVEGFHVGAINELAFSMASATRGAPLETPLSEPFTLASFDVRSGERLSDGTHRLSVPVTADGTALGYVRWIGWGFAGGAFYENSPGRKCYWVPVFWPFPRPREVQKGDVVEMVVTRVESSVFADPA